MSAGGDVKIYADDEIQRNKEEMILESCDLEIDFTKDSKPYQPTCDELCPVLREKYHIN